MQAEPESPADAEDADDPRPGFAELGVSAALVEALAADEITVPTEIQTLAIPPLLDGRDLIGQARTGTGKTAAFAIPLIQRLDPARAVVQAVVLAPTRELALQVQKVCRRFARVERALRVVAIYGGAAYRPQLEQLARGAQIVVATPGRLIDLLDRGAVDLAHVAMVVIDEADEMLKMGFVDDIERILGALPEGRQSALFSATMPPPIRRVAVKHLRAPVDARTATAGETAADIDQQLVYAPEASQIAVLDRLLHVERGERTLVFVRTRDGALEVADALVARGHRAAGLSGAMSQAMRTEVLRAFRDGRIRVLVGTDVAARGLDIDDLTHVVNIGPPDNADSYVHRIGRTGRAGRTGVAISLLDPSEHRVAFAIEQRLGVTLRRRPWPTAAEVDAARSTAIVARLAEVAADEDALARHLAAVDQLVALGFDVRTIAAAAACLAEGDRPAEPDDPGVEPAAWFIGAGEKDRVRPADIVGALCNELGLARAAIGRIDIGRSRALFWIDGPAALAKLARVESIILRGRPTAIWPEGGTPPKLPRPAPPEKKPEGAKPRPDRPAGPRRPASEQPAAGEKPFSGWKGRQGRRGHSTRHRNDR
ncbi:MAG: DEAD/DEAH box helicase [Myxococcales bacterium]|nr:DEAD/DEAH box helicase [Myxococcales bacterium]